MDSQNPIIQAETPEKKPVPIANMGKIKKIIIWAIVGIVIILVGIIAYIFINRYEINKSINNNQKIINDLFTLRQEAAAHYQSNKSYKDWTPTSGIASEVKTLGSEVIVRIPDYQTYIMYAYIPNDQKYLCFDSTNFADEVSQVSDSQTKCQ